MNHKIFIRAPKGLKGPTETFGFDIEQGKFDDAYTFLDPEKQASLHILARVNTPKGPATRRRAPIPPTRRTRRRRRPSGVILPPTCST